MTGPGRPSHEKAAGQVPGLAVVLCDARTWLAALLLCLAVVLTFRPCLDNGLSRDDADSLDDTHAGTLGGQSLRRMLTTFQDGRYQPLAWASLSLEHQLWDSNARAYHWCSLAGHLANSLLVYLLGVVLIAAAHGTDRELRPALAYHAGAWLAALLFASHPLRVEVVAWASQCGMILSTLFLLLAVLFYVRATIGAAHGHWLPASLVCYVLSLAAGPLGVTLPIILLALDWYPLHRLGGARGRWLGRAVRGVWLEKLPFVALAGAAAAVGVVAQRLSPPAFSAPDSSAAEHLARTAYGFVFYVWKTVWPLGLLPISEPPSPFEFLSLKYLGSLAAVFVAVIVLAAYGRHRPAIAVAALCYAASLVPAATLLHGGPEEVADRHSYLPSIALMLLIGGGLSQLWLAPARPLRWLAGGLTLLGLLAASGLAALTRQQCAVWRTPLTLWTYAVEHEPEEGQRSGVARYMLARQYDEVGQTERAVQLYQAALSVRPTLREAYRDLGGALMQMARPDEAIAMYRRALALDPQRALTHWQLAGALAANDQFDPAEEHLRRAIALEPGSVAFRSSLGHLLMIRGRWNEAAEAFRAALVLDPRSAPLHHDLGRAYQRSGHSHQAAEAFRRALELDPEHKLARRALEEVTTAPADR